MLQPRHATVPSNRNCRRPSCYCELLAIRHGRKWRNDPSLALTGRNRRESDRGDGVDDFICWVAAGIRICSDGKQRQHGSHRECPHCEQQPPIPGTGAGRRRVRRAGARQLGDGGRHAAQGTLSSSGVRLERLLHWRSHRLQPRLLERGALRSAGSFDQRQRLQRRDRRRTGRL